MYRATCHDDNRARPWARSRAAEDGGARSGTLGCLEDSRSTGLCERHRNEDARCFTRRALRIVADVFDSHPQMQALTYFENASRVIRLFANSFAHHRRRPCCNRTVAAPCRAHKKMGDTFCVARFRTSHVTSGHYLTLPAFQAERSWSYFTVSPFGFSLASFFQGACSSDSHFDGSLCAFISGAQTFMPARCKRANT
jgi:hypothetical protein